MPTTIDKESLNAIPERKADVKQTTIHSLTSP